MARHCIFKPLGAGSPHCIPGTPGCPGPRTAAACRRSPAPATLATRSRPPTPERDRLAPSATHGPPAVRRLRAFPSASGIYKSGLFSTRTTSMSSNRSHSAGNMRANRRRCHSCSGHTKTVLVICVVAYVERVVGIGRPVEIVLVGLVVDIRRIVVGTPLQFGAPGIWMGQPPSDPSGARRQCSSRIGVAAAGRYTPVPRLLLQFNATIAGRNLSIRPNVRGHRYGPNPFICQGCHPTRDDGLNSWYGPHPAGCHS